MAALTVILFESMWIWALVPVLALLMLIRQAYATLLEIRETYHTTISVLVDVAESPEPGRKGHSERVAEIARAIGSGCGLRTAELERLSYAALLHDVHGIADTAPRQGETPGYSADVVSEVGFLSDVVPILHVLDGRPTESASERDLLSALIVALASDVDMAASKDTAAAHGEPMIKRIGGIVPLRLKAKVVSAAVSLGYSVPAID